MACYKTNMLASITVLAGSPTGMTGTHTYQYDVLGRRVRRTVTGTTPSDTVYIHLGQRVYAEYPATVSWSSPNRFYAYGSYVDEPIALIDFTAAGAAGAGTVERFYYHRNQQYSITALTNQAGAVVERYAYTA